MYKPKIFLVDEENEALLPLEETGYVTEADLQELLANYPDLLAGDQIDPENPRRWMLVSREMGVPGAETEVGRWSLDHLFIDQDGIPTFVECKRATDTRIRREVVAQMLDYAANGTKYWTSDRMRQAAAETAQSRGKILEDVIAELLAGGSDIEGVEDFWKVVTFNLQQHHVRLVFVADSTPRELRSLIEFLNEEMSNVEVLAVEIKRFQGTRENEVALVPRVVGLTEAARSAKEPKRKTRTNRDEFLSQCAPRVRDFFEQVLDRAEERGHLVSWGELGFSIRAYAPQIGRHATFILAYPPETFQFFFQRSDIVPEEHASALRQKLLDFGVFEESGQFTLTTHLSEQDLERMNKVYNFVLDRVEQFIDIQEDEGG